MKRILVYLAAFLLATLFLVVTNMGEVLLFFKVLTLPVALTIVGTVALTSLSGLLAAIIISTVARTKPMGIAWAVIGYQSIMTTGNLILNQSLEPVWYKVVYLVTVSLSIMLAIRRLGRSSTLFARG